MTFDMKCRLEFAVGVEQLSNPNSFIKVSMEYLLHIIMILLELYLLVQKHIYYVGRMDMLLRFAPPYQWVV